MRFLILNTDYPDFLSWLYGGEPELAQASYQRQMQVRNESLFGVADFYSSNLRELGYEAWDVHANNGFMQRAWAKEQGLPLDESHWIDRAIRKALRQGARGIPKKAMGFVRSLFGSALSSFNGHGPWFYQVLEAQIKHYRPDILLNQTMTAIPGSFLRQVKKHVRLVVGQIASPLPQGDDYGVYDLIISSLPNFVNYFRQMKVPSELHRLAFEPKILNCIRTGGEPSQPLSFVGSLSKIHGERVRLLETLCSKLEIQVWGQLQGISLEGSPIAGCYRGPAWGAEMYTILRNSKITLNHHIGLAESYANNSRLYEATGVGPLLVTDYKNNLADMFDPGKEVAVYRTAEECSEMIRYYLDHESDRHEVARAGQQRTLKEHTYRRRMEELALVIKKYV